jgi:hypothetical protein
MPKTVISFEVLNGEALEKAGGFYNGGESSERLKRYLWSKSIDDGNDSAPIAFIIPASTTFRSRQVDCSSKVLHGHLFLTQR